MPKKRAQFKQYSKPPSTAPASLSSTAAGAGSHNGEPESRNVNQLLADLRRLGVKVSNSNAQGALDVRPTVPPVIRDILQLPETPAPRPRPGRGRGGPRVDALGRRLPPGPAPPESWLNRRTQEIVSTVPRQSGSDRPLDQHMLPGLYLPARGSLVDWTLRQFAHSWDFQREYCRYYLYHLPTHLREALMTYLSIWKDTDNLTLSDLKAILLPPQKQEGDEADEADDELLEEDYVDPSIANKDFRYLDLSHSIGTSISLRELTDLLFPPKPAATKAKTPISAAPLETAEPKESWEDSEADEEDELRSENPNVPRSILPNLTHLSLSLPPNPTSSSTFTTPGTFFRDHNLPSWRHLLTFASHHPTLTHLSLANWPEPSLTPNAKYASFVTAQGRRIQYGGTGPYSHSLDNDWSEAILVLRRLSRAWYRLEWLDLRGCSGWWEALWAVTRGPGGDLDQDGMEPGGTARGGGELVEGEGDRVDWRVDWGKVETVVLGLEEEKGKLIGRNEEAMVEKGKTLEKHVRGVRKGRGRWFGVC